MLTDLRVRWRGDYKQVELRTQKTINSQELTSERKHYALIILRTRPSPLNPGNKSFELDISPPGIMFTY